MASETPETPNVSSEDRVRYDFLVIQRLDRIESRLDYEAGQLRTEIGQLRTEMRTEIGQLRTEMRGEIGGLRNEMNSLRIWMIGTIISVVVGFGGVIVTLVLTKR